MGTTKPAPKRKIAEALARISCTELARRSKTTPGYVSLLFRGLRDGRVDTLERIADVLGVSLGELHDYLKNVRSGATASVPRGWSQPRDMNPAATKRSRSRSGAGVAA